MNFFFDEYFPLSIKRDLEQQGHNVTCAMECCPQGTNDEILFQYAQKNGAVFLTTDKDFFHTVPFIYQQRTAAVVVITLRQPNRKNIQDRFHTLLKSTDLQSNTQSVFLVTDKRILKKE